MNKENYPISLSWGESMTQGKNEFLAHSYELGFLHITARKTKVNFFP